MTIIAFDRGFVPDQSELDPQNLSACVDVIPGDRGMKYAPTAIAVPSVGVLAAFCRGAFAGRKLDATVRTFAGTSTKLYELVGTTWTDRSAGGGTYTTTKTWCYAQFGDITLATNDNDNIQQTSSGAFAAIANAPKARIVIAVPNFAIALNTQNGSASSTFGDSPDRWWSSAYQNPNDWAINATNQCVSERLIGGGGEITAAAPFGTGWVAYKLREMFHAHYTGDAGVFTTQRVLGNWGCVGPRAVAEVEGSHFVVGEDDIFIYDGARAVSVASGKVRNWLFSIPSADSLDREVAYLTRVCYDKARGLVWVFYPVLNGGGTLCKQALVYHLATGRWGTSKYAMVNSLTLGVDDAFVLSYEATGPDDVAVFNSSHQIMTLDGAGITTASSLVLPRLTTGMFGANGADTMLYRAHIVSASGNQVTVNAASDLPLNGSGGAGLTTVAGAVRAAESVVDFRSTAAYHSIQWSLEGDFDVSGCEAKLQPAGGRA